MYDSQQKNLEIQAIRAISIVLVLIAHVPVVLFEPDASYYANSVFHCIHPQVGVNLFFIISGYLMGKTFLERFAREREIGEKFSEIIIYYKRRFLRLYPASLFWITLTLVMGIMLNPYNGLWLPADRLFHQWLASIFLLRNFEESANATHLGYYWSLSMEWQFYILLPLCVYFIPRRLFWGVAFSLVLLAAVWRPGGMNWWMFRYDGMIYGLLLYEIEQKGYLLNIQQAFISSHQNWLKRSIVFFLLLFLIVITPVVMAGKQVKMVTGGATFMAVVDSPLHNLAWTFVNVLGVILLAYSILKKIMIDTPKIVQQGIYWMGEFSYSIYLCHIPVWLMWKSIMRGTHMETVSPIIEVSAGTAFVFASAVATYFFIEKPFIQMSKKLKAKNPAVQAY